MSFTQKDLIVAYREEGLNYREIAEKTGASEQFCRTVCSRANRKQKADAPPAGMCRYCGKELIHTDKAKKKQFCSDQCRTAFYNREKKHRGFVRTCEWCKKDFVSFGYPKKRYCCRACRTAAERRARD